MITSKQASVICLAGLLGLVVTQQGCGSDPSAPTGTPAAGAPAAGAAPIPMAGAPSTGGGGAASAGAPAGGAPAGGAPAGGGGSGGASAGAGTGGGSGGTGGGSGGASGGSAGMGTGGGSAVTFAQIKTLFGTSCGVGMCHNKASGNLDYQGTADLHGLLTTAIPQGTAHCVGSVLVTPNDANSFLISIVKGGTSCPKGGGTIGRMPDNCKTTAGGMPQCLTTEQIKLISDWVAAGAPG